MLALQGWGRTRAARLRTAALPVAQCAVAAGLAWFVATALIGHARPFFAPIAAIVCLGISLGAKLRRTVELVAGVVTGIVVADLIISVIGSGAWQITLVVALAMGTAVLLDGGPVITLQAGSSSVLVATLLPPGQSGGPDRAVDALVGGVVAVLVIALLPSSPLRTARRDAATVLQAVEDAVRGVADGLATHDADVVERALVRARSTQATLDALRADLSAGREVARLAPLRRRTRGPVASLTAMAEPIDNAARNVRVLARRALVVVGDGEVVSDALVHAVRSLADAVVVLRVLAGSDPGSGTTPAEVSTALRAVARELTPELGLDGGLSVRVVVAQLRSTVVDLMQAAGSSRIAALATLPPTVEHPAYPPEVG